MITANKISVGGEGDDTAVKMTQEERTQLLRTFAALSKGLGSVPSTDMAVHNHLKLQFQGILHTFVTHLVLGTHMIHIIYADIICTHINKNKTFKILPDSQNIHLPKVTLNPPLFDYVE